MEDGSPAVPVGLLGELYNVLPLQCFIPPDLLFINEYPHIPMRQISLCRDAAEVTRKGKIYLSNTHIKAPMQGAILERETRHRDHGDIPARESVNGQNVIMEQES